MKYLIVGAGGTGGCIGGYLAASGKDVTFIARGAHLKAMKEKGLVIHSSWRSEIELKNVKVCDEIDETVKFDVILVCVKGYSLNGVLPMIKKASHKDTAVIPILNTLSAGEKLGEAFPDITVLGGCIYVSAYISAPGEITQGIKIFRVVFGSMKGTDSDRDLLLNIQADLVDSGIEGIVSDDIRRDVFRKLSFTSACAAAGAYFDVAAGEMQKGGEFRDMFIALLKELQKIAKVLNIHLSTDLVDENLNILAGLAPDTTTSMQKDMKAGKTSEADELIFDVVRIANEYDVDAPNYKKIATHFGYQ